MALLGKKTGVSRQFVASPAVSGLARDQVSGALRGWGLPFLVSDAVLVVGELVANAVKVSGTADVIKVYVGLGAGEVVLGVWDGCDGRPVARKVEISLETLDLSEENFDDNGGRGLAIVEALAWRCWTDPTPPQGKWVCAALNAEGRR
ncbi:ATP-binding protein [Actinomadura soli]|uniref:ATP-binding protein n=1 Tax=Actinomadura soli TaxID=2508997 RepID=A0A5C4J647_9ACTN|nr:ATP-binding protein [Actinomadura soli]TMQ92132.1 ATP-binding protein [Actinomadura soli]